MGLGMALGGAAEGFRSTAKTLQDMKMQQQQYDIQQDQYERQKRIREQLAQLPAEGTQSPLEWHDPNSGQTFTSPDQIQQYAQQQAALPPAGNNPDEQGNGKPVDATALASQIQGRMQPTKYKSYGAGDKAADMAKIYESNGDPLGGMQLRATALQLKGAMRNDAQEDEVNAAGQRYKERLQSIAPALQSYIQGDPSKLDGLQQQVAAAYNNDPAHDDGRQIQFGKTAQGVPTYSILDKDGKPLEQGPVTPAVMQKGFQTMLQNEMIAADPRKLTEFQKMGILSQHAAAATAGAKAAQQNADTNEEFHGEGGVYERSMQDKTESNAAIAGARNDAALARIQAGSETAAAKLAAQGAVQSAALDVKRQGVAQAAELARIKGGPIAMTDDNQLVYADGSTKPAPKGLKRDDLFPKKTGDQFEKTPSATAPKEDANTKELVKKRAGEIADIDMSKPGAQNKLNSVMKKYSAVGLPGTVNDPVLDALKANAAKGNPFAGPPPGAAPAKKGGLPGPRPAMPSPVNSPVSDLGIPLN